MNQQSMTRMLTRIRLINWHYFSNETIQVKGSFLLSGDNSSGKSTILDAIQMVLTTSTRNFNEAAHEKSKRSLKGYVRGKTGVEGQTYKIPANKSTISYVALEFYEPRKERYFVLGVKLDSPNEEAEIKKSWFCEEGTLDALTFLADGKPATDQQFKKNGQRVTLLRQTSDAKERFRRRMGNLGGAFFDLIPKSMAFRPMNDIKSFINQYILPEHPISTETLRENIQNLQEMQRLVKELKRQIGQLDEIISVYQKVRDTQRQHKEIELLLDYARQDSARQQIDVLTRERLALDQQKRVCEEQKLIENQNLASEQAALASIQAAIGSSENGHLIRTLEQEIKTLEGDAGRISAQVRTLEKQIQLAKAVQKALPGAQDAVQLGEMLQAGTQTDLDARHANIIAMQQQAEKQAETLRLESANLHNQRQQLREQIGCLQEEIGKLEKNRFSYPKSTELLRARIAQEFARRSIDAPISVFAEMLEIKEPEWQNALEGYLNTQRFYLVVPPEYYGIAAQVYDKHKSTIHSVALVNTQALNLDNHAEPDSLAAVVTSENRYAMAYVCDVLNRVKRCQSVDELKKHSAAITAGCMLYQAKALRKLNPAIYEEPYIGRRALQQQLENKRSQLAQLSEQLKQNQSQYSANQQQIAQLTRCKFDLLLEHLSAPIRAAEVARRMTEKKAELQEAQNNPTYLELQMKYDQCQKRLTEIQSR